MGGGGIKISRSVKDPILISTEACTTVGSIELTTNELQIKYNYMYKCVAIV